MRCRGYQTNPHPDPFPRFSENVEEAGRMNPFCPSGVEGLLELSEFAERKTPLDSARGDRRGQFVISINPETRSERSLSPIGVTPR